MTTKESVVIYIFAQDGSKIHKNSAYLFHIQDEVIIPTPYHNIVHHFLYWAFCPPVSINWKVVMFADDSEKYPNLCNGRKETVEGVFLCFWSPAETYNSPVPQTLVCLFGSL